MEHGTTVKKHSTKRFLMFYNGTSEDIKISKMKLDLDSPVPFVEESNGEITTLASGVFGINLTFADAGEFLYKINLGPTAIEYIKVDVVLADSTDLLKESINLLSKKVENLNDADNAKLDEILYYLTLINAQV